MLRTVRMDRPGNPSQATVIQKSEPVFAMGVAGHCHFGGKLLAREMHLARRDQGHLRLTAASAIGVLLMGGRAQNLRRGYAWPAASIRLRHAAAGAVESNDDGIQPHDGSVVRPYSFGQVTMLAPASSTSKSPSKAFDRLCTPWEQQVLRAQLPGPRRSTLAPWAKTILSRGRSNAPRRRALMASGARALGLGSGSASALSLEQVFSPPLMKKAASRPK